MARVLDVQGLDYLETDDDVQRPIGTVGVPESSVLLIAVKVVVTRLSDGASKAWALEALVRRGPTGNVSVLQVVPAPPTTFATAGDALALAAVTIALYSDPTAIGINCTGIAGVPLAWATKLIGRGVTPAP